MKFRSWLEFSATSLGGEAGMGANIPDILASSNRGSDTPASDAVKRTGLQPQVDAQEIETKEKDQQDRILAIDGGVERLDSIVPGGGDAPKLAKFRSLWQQFKDKWDKIKTTDDAAVSALDDGLGDTNDEKYQSTMRQRPNMVLAPNQYPAGPGTFGVS